MTQTRSEYRRRARRHCLAVLGDHLRLSVDHGDLVIRQLRDGEPHEDRYARAYSPFNRLVVVGSHGLVTLAALRWLADVKASFVHIDAIGRVTTSSAPSSAGDARLRRSQALAPFTAAGLEIAKALIGAKLQGQADTLQPIVGPEPANAIIAPALDHLHTATSLGEIRILEARVAEQYWRAWADVPMRFVGRDHARTPAHWQRVGPRGSPLTLSPRRAVTPAHALRNLMLALLEAEANRACAVMGLDATLGILHADQPGRSSFSLDLMEAGRGAIDAQLLQLLGQRAFRRAEFCEEPDGNVRIHPELARQACQATRTDDLLSTHAERVAWILAQAPITPPSTLPAGRAIKIATRLSESNRSAGRDLVRTAPRRQQPTPPLDISAVCNQCGAALVGRGRKLCAECHQTENLARLEVQRASELACRSATGLHPSRRTAVREAIATKQKAHWAARRGDPHSVGYQGTPSEFRRLILPNLQTATPAYLAQATGLSPGYVAQIRNGIRTPHPRHWAALHLAGLQTDHEAVGPGSAPNHG